MMHLALPSQLILPIGSLVVSSKNQVTPVDCTLYNKTPALALHPSLTICTLHSSTCTLFRNRLYSLEQTFVQLEISRLSKTPVQQVQITARFSATGMNSIILHLCAAYNPSFFPNQNPHLWHCKLDCTGLLINGLLSNCIDTL